MSTIVVVKKEGKAVIASDTLTTWGNTKESAKYVINHAKVIKYQDNYLGISGAASLQVAVEDFLTNLKKDIKLSNISNIFHFGLKLHKKLKNSYHLSPDSDDGFETLSGDILIANAKGIFGLSEYRFVQEYSRFYANGSGTEYALGAMFAVYKDSEKSAQTVAEIGVQAGVEFDDGSAIPIQSYKVELQQAEN